MRSLQWHIEDVCKNSQSEKAAWTFAGGKKMLFFYVFFNVNQPLEVKRSPQATPPKLRRDVGMYGNAANQKLSETKNTAYKVRTSNNHGSPAMMHEQSTTVPPLLSHDRKQQ